MMKARHLLSTGNPKILKGAKFGYTSHILHLAPHTMSGYNTCAKATAGCSAACLNTAGRGGLFAGEKTGVLSGLQVVDAIKSGALHNVIQTARIAKTIMFFEQRNEFFAQLVDEIEKAVVKARNAHQVPVFRLNGTSDIPWEVYPVKRKGLRYSSIFTAFPTVRFYDYSKIFNRKNRAKIPDNYSLTFSRSETNHAEVLDILAKGENVAVVFSTKKGKPLPETWNGYSVVDGDAHDLRFLDPKNVVVGLRGKGKAKVDTGGFVVTVDERQNYVGN